MRFKFREFLPVGILLAALCVCAAVALAAYVDADRRLPTNIGYSLEGEELAEVVARNSPLIRHVCLSPNADFPRKDEIKKITIHHMADNDLSIERLGEVFAEKDRRASANYAVGIDGGIALYVEEKDRAWTSSSPENDHQAVTIEVANDEIGGDWHVGDKSYEALIELCVDICQRNGIEELVWTGDETGSLTIHKFFREDTECPGPYLESRMPDIAEEVTRRLHDQEGNT